MVEEVIVSETGESKDGIDRFNVRDIVEAIASSKSSAVTDFTEELDRYDYSDVPFEEYYNNDLMIASNRRFEEYYKNNEEDLSDLWDIALSVIIDNGKDDEIRTSSSKLLVVLSTLRLSMVDNKALETSESVRKYLEKDSTANVDREVLWGITKVWVHLNATWQDNKWGGKVEPEQAIDIPCVSNYDLVKVKKFDLRRATHDIRYLDGEGNEVPVIHAWAIPRNLTGNYLREYYDVEPYLLEKEEDKRYYEASYALADRLVSGGTTNNYEVVPFSEKPTVSATAIAYSNFTGREVTKPYYVNHKQVIIAGSEIVDYKVVKNE